MSRSFPHPTNIFIHSLVINSNSKFPLLSTQMLFAYGKLHKIFTQLYCPTKVSLCQARLNHSLFFLASIFPASLHSCTGSSCFESHKPKRIHPHLTGYQAAATQLGKLQSRCLGPAAATALINGPSWSSFAASLSTQQLLLANHSSLVSAIKATFFFLPLLVPGNSTS